MLYTASLNNACELYLNNTEGKPPPAKKKSPFKIKIKEKAVIIKCHYTIFLSEDRRWGEPDPSSVSAVLSCPCLRMLNGVLLPSRHALLLRLAVHSAS